MTTLSIRGLLISVCTGMVLFWHGAAGAAPVVTVPAGLSPGDAYRLVFVTAGLAQATSIVINDYDSFVAAQAAGSPVLAALGTNWRVLGSTPGTDAMTHTGTDPLAGAGVPIYNLAGQLVALNNADLWDGNLSNAIAIDQNGDVVAQKVHTGTAPSGTAIADRELGSNVARVQFGQADLANSGWTSIDWSGSLTGLHYYGISDSLTVVPEPVILPLFAIGLIGLMRRRHRPRGVALPRSRR